MSESPYTAFPQIQWAGPTDSDTYNTRIENEFRDLVVLYNISRVLGEDIREGFGRYSKEQLALAKVLSDLELRVSSLEQAQRRLTFASNSQIDNDRFTGTPYEITPTAQCTQDPYHGIMTLPQVPGSSISKLFFVDPSTGTSSLPSTLTTNVVAVAGTADDAPNALIDTSDPSLAIISIPGRLWERNIIVPSPHTTGAQCQLYVRCPTDLFTIETSNMLVIHPFPAMGVSVTGIEYTTVADPVMQDSDGYTPLNSQELYAGIPAAIGWVPPGGWTGDTYTDAGPKAYTFPPLKITGLRISLRQDTYYIENEQFVYSYGMSQLGLSYTKFLGAGQFIVRYDVPTGHTASVVTSVQPEIWNIAQASIPDVFSYQVLYETSLNSGTYTTTPVGFSQRFWVLVSMTADPATGASPALSGLDITYE